MASTSIGDCFINIELPPPVPFDYTPKGTWQQVGELYSYTTGPTTSTRAVVMIYDVFGPSPQCLQGADKLAEHLNALVLLPDYFKGCSLDHEDFIRESVQNRTALEEHMKSHGDYQRNIDTTIRYVNDAQLKFPFVQSWGGFGLCWGGKVVVLTSMTLSNPFRVTGQAHPSRLDANDARAMPTPHVCLASKDEPSDVLEQYAQNLAARNLGEVQLFGSMAHGWMGARANLKDHVVKNDYERGYAQVARFFSQYL